MKTAMLLRYLLLLLIIPVLSGGCRSKTGSGQLITETRTTRAFNGISVSGDFNVEITIGNHQEVVVEADDNLIKNIETNVVNGTLRISTSDHNLRNPHFTVHISAPVIDNINAAASANIEVKNTLHSEKTIELSASSAGEVTASVDAPEITAEASSAGEMHISGRTKTFNATVSSGAALKAMELLAENTIVSSSSGASAKVHASVLLDASASSGGDITYRGGGNVKKSVSSGGEINKED